jgi:hypothetical protein
MGYKVIIKQGNLLEEEYATFMVNMVLKYTNVRRMEPSTTGVHSIEFMRNIG